MSNPYYGLFFQDTWRASPNLTLNFGLRYEYEDGIRESEDRWLTEFDPDAQAGDHATWRRRPTRAIRSRRSRSASSACSADRCTPAPRARAGRAGTGESMWMPRVSGAYKLGERTVVKGGYGLFFDTLNAGDYGGFNQFGYSVDDHERRPARTSAGPGCWGIR